MKTYFTLREVSVHTNELWALRALGSEVFKDGSGGGGPWVRAHLGSGGRYIAQWVTPLDGTSGETDLDEAIGTNGLSRYANYYVEGVRALLAPPVQLDGLYYDGIDFDVETMRRIRRVADTVRDECG